MSDITQQKQDRAMRYLNDSTHELRGTRLAFAHWFMHSDWDDERAAWKDYQRQVLNREVQR